jgi:hypothetical protein
MFGRKKEEEDPITTLARCIVLLDDIRAYRRKDVERIDEVFSRLKKTRFKDHYEIWVKARPAAEKIVDMPEQVEGVPKLIRAISWLRVANRVALIGLVFFLAIQIVPIWRRTLGPDFLEGNAFLYSTISVLVLVVAMNFQTYLDFRVRKKIVAYEEATMDQYSSSREKMKSCVDKMLHSLAKETVKSGVDTRYWGLILYFDDYDNIQVVKQWRPKSMWIFKKSYNHYQVIPKL